MNRFGQVIVGLALTALAGYVDALGFIRLGGLYTSFMSGNTTQFAVYLSEGERHRLALPACLVGSFLAGAILGSTLAILLPPRWASTGVLLFETVLVTAALVIGLVAPEPGGASFALAGAMGAQNAVLSGVKGFRAGTTFVTGALFGLGRKIAEALTRTGEPFGWSADALVWLSLLVGALSGAAAYGAFGLYALIIPAVAASLLAAGTTLLAVRAGPSPKAPR